ncbi:MAG TPA: PAS domain S-box protein, partial [Dehalococcoidia bacterium]|nr:PAS domain S-box protein [Dehalococcoidia bacterium]
MSAQHRHDAQDRASEPVEWGAWSFDPASEAHQRPQETSFPFPGSSPLCTRAGPEPDCMRLAEILRESEERFRGLTEAAFEGILIHEDGRILGANQRLAEMLGYELSELIGMEAPRLVAPEWRDFVLQTRLSGCEEPYEAVGLRKDGSTFLAELCGKCVRYDGRTVRVAAIRDITERKRAEEALRESDKKFRHVLDSSRDMVYCLNLKTFTYDYLSPSCKEVLGYSPEEFAALGFMGAGSLVHPDDVQRVLENFAQVRTHPNVEYRFRHKELGYRWMSDSRSVVFDDKGGAAVVGALRDITKRKRAEEALRQAELRYRFLFEQAPAMYVITRSENGSPIVTDCNELFLTTLGYPRVEVLGRPLADFYAPLSRDRLLEHGGYQRALEGRFCAEGRQLVTRDGRVVETVLRAVPEFDDGGRTIGTRATYLNITERKRAEEALRESEERFRRLCDATIEGIVIHDGRKILDANQALAAMLGYDVSEIVGRDGLEFVAPGYRGLVEQNILSGYEAPYEALCLKRDGSTFPAEVRGKVIPYDGRLARVTAVRDITERK